MEDPCKIPDNLRERIMQCKSIAVMPFDDNALSECYRTARFFQDLGWRIYPIHDRCERIIDEACYRDIRLIPDDYDILLLFCSSDQLPEVVNSVFNADYMPPIVWGHTGTFDRDSCDRLFEADIMVVMDRNLMTVYRTWLEEEGR